MLAADSGALPAAARERIRRSLLQHGGMHEAAEGKGCTEGGAAAAAAFAAEVDEEAAGDGCGSPVPSRASSLPAGLHGGRLARAAEPRFLVDAMMGRLLRWLRVLGVDSLLR